MGKLIIMNNSSWRSKYGNPNYRHIALVELEDGYDGYPAMISERARGIKRIIDEYDGIYVGKTPKSYGYRILEDWRKMIENRG